MTPSSPLELPPKHHHPRHQKINNPSRQRTLPPHRTPIPLPPPPHPHPLLRTCTRARIRIRTLRTIQSRTRLRTIDSNRRRRRRNRIIMMRMIMRRSMLMRMWMRHDNIRRHPHLDTPTTTRRCRDHCPTDQGTFFVFEDCER